MKLDRRKFLAMGTGLIGGTAAGIALSPVVFKLQDDSSIWSQNWPWTPVPMEGEVTYEDTICTLCPGQCGISVRKIGKRVVKIEGRDGFPVNNGGICILGLCGPQLLYGPTRVKSPMKKVDGKFVKVSWDEAISLVEEKLNALRDEGLSDSVAVISGNESNVKSKLFERFLKAYGSPNFLKTPSALDSYEFVFSQTVGEETRPVFDFENSDFILSFGCGVVDGWGSPVRMFRNNSSMGQDATFVQVEPRLSNSAAAANISSNTWLASNPGTEGVLALGMAAVILNMNLYKSDLYDSDGFDEWKTRVTSEYGLASVASITGLSEEKIKAVALAFAKAKAPVAICGRGHGHTPGKTFEFMAVQSLNALVGSLNAVGGVSAVPKSDYISWDDVDLDDSAYGGYHKERIDGAGVGGYKYAESLLHKLPEVINSNGDSPVKLLFITDANPCYTMPDTTEVLKAFNKVDFKVSFSSYMDETTAVSDLILPDHMYLEKYQDVDMTYASSKPAIGLGKPAVFPLFDTRNSGDVLIELAGKLGGTIADAFPWDSYETCLSETLGELWDTLLEEGIQVDEEYEPEEEFFSFAGSDLTQNDVLTYHSEIPENSLMLIPVDSIRLASGQLADPPFAVKIISDKVLKDKDILVEINPVTAKKLKLSAGDKIILKTEVGSAKARVNIYEGIMPNLVGMPTGLGHTAYDKYIGGKGENFYSLIKPVEDNVTGYDVARGIGVSVTKA